MLLRISAAPKSTTPAGFLPSFNTDWSRYDCFVDAATGEVVGFNSEPYIDSDYIFDQEGGAAWRSNIAASK